jgi:hypothetical protein
VLDASSSKVASDPGAGFVGNPRTASSSRALSRSPGATYT